MLSSFLYFLRISFGVLFLILGVFGVVPHATKLVGADQWDFREVAKYSILLGAGLGLLLLGAK